MIKTIKLIQLFRMIINRKFMLKNILKQRVKIAEIIFSMSI